MLTIDFVYHVIIFETSNVQHKSRRVYGKINQCLFYYFKGKFNGISSFMVILIVNVELRLSNIHIIEIDLCVSFGVVCASSEVLFLSFGRCKLLLMIFLYVQYTSCERIKKTKNFMFEKDLCKWKMN